MRLLVLLVALVGCGKREGERADQPPPPKPHMVPKAKSGCESPGKTVCVDEDVVECTADGKLGATVTKCNGGCNAGKCVETCALRDAELIYTIDVDRRLRSFDPRKLPNDPFHVVGKLTCDSRSTP